MGVNDARIPLAGDGAQLARRANVPFAPKSESIRGKSRVLSALDQRRTGGSDDENVR